MGQVRLKQLVGQLQVVGQLQAVVAQVQVVEQVQVVDQVVVCVACRGCGRLVGRSDAQMQLKHWIPNTQFLGWRPTPLLVWGKLPEEGWHLVGLAFDGAMHLLWLSAPLCMSCP